MESAPDSDTSVNVIIPWRPQPDRLAAFDRVEEWWLDHGYVPIFVDSDSGKPFNLSQARNNGVRKSRADIVVLADADTIPDQHALERGIRRAQFERVIYPFDKYVYLAADADPASDMAVSDMPQERLFTNSHGGIMVVRRDIYWDLGGHDENFRQWGFEDTAFQLAAECLYDTERVEGTIYAFNHTAERDLSSDNPGRARVALYRFARRDPAVMRELLIR